MFCPECGMKMGYVKTVPDVAHDHDVYECPKDGFWQVDHRSDGVVALFSGAGDMLEAEEEDDN